MEQLFNSFSTLLDFLFFKIISPVFLFISQGLEMLLIQPLKLLNIPAALQVMVIAVLAGCLSISIRRILKVEEKEMAFKETFTRKKESQDDLQLISDWKSRETYAKTIDDDIDNDFNSYLAERFARHGMIYLLPIFLSLFWLETVIEPSGILFYLPENRFGIQGIYQQFVFLLTYCLFLLTFFRMRRRKMGAAKK